jgi:hypothetical protein
MYHLILYVHLIAAAVWFGGTAALQVLVLRAQLSGDGQRLGNMSKEAEWMGTGVLLPASVVLLAAGVGMALKGPYGFGEPFVIVGLLGFSSSLVIGSMLGVFGKRMKSTMEERGYTDPGALKIRGQIFLLSRIEIVILLVVVFCMVTKPGTTMVLAT